MKTVVLFLILFGLSVAGALAQVNVKQIDINSTSGSNTISKGDLISNYSDVTGISYQQQLTADANQVANINIAGNYNNAQITQGGSSNTGAINISGSNNTTTLDQQGTNLLSLIYINGNSNVLGVTQRDQDVGNLVQVEGSGLNMNLTQDKTGFRYTQGGAGNPVTITSTKNYVPVIINNH